jgi:TonB family protein
LLRTWAPPVYPPDALQQKVGGIAVVRMVVDEKGDVASARILEADDPRLGAAALAAARQWRFTPALDDGKAVACSLDAPVMFSPADEAKKKKPGIVPPPNQTPQPSPRTPAKQSATYAADYPDSLNARKISGLVRFKCSVGSDGKASAIRVIAASHADFVIPALLSIDQWEFTPAMQGDLPVKSEIAGDVTFNALAASTADVLAANQITSPDGTPPALQPKPIVVADPVLPLDLLLKGEGGSATVAFTVGEDGRTRDVELRAATNPEFGSALVSALEATVFATVSDGIKPVPVQLLQHADFPALAPTAADDSDPVARLVAALRNKQIGSAQGLDERLTPIYRVAPVYPAGLLSQGRPAGHAEIEFIIDRDGRARLPNIVSATNMDFGWAAATAVAQWIFKAPHRGGKPVDVKVRIPFDFKAPQA